MDQLKKNIENGLKDLSSHPLIKGLWFGGSRATGFEDELSDTDIVGICESPSEFFIALEKYLASIADVDQIWHVEGNPWPQFYQKFYIFKEGAEVYYLDAGVFTSQDPYLYREYFNGARHGKPEIIFDTDGILQRASLMDTHLESPSLNTANFLARFEVMYRTFLKEALRGKFIDAHVFYMRSVQLYVQVLRYDKAPQKHDFGLRYIYRDLKADAENIERYFKVTTIEQMIGNAKEIRKILTQQLRKG